MATIEGGWTGPGEGTTIVVDASVNVGQTWTLTGPEGFVASDMHDAVLRDLPAGDYTISWDTVDGYSPPSPASEGPISVGASGFYVFTSPIYVPVFGSVIVNVTPDSSQTWTLYGPDVICPYAGTGDETKTGLVAGEYTVSFDALAGWLSPPDATDTLTADTSINLDGVYEELGSIQVTPGTTPQTYQLTGPYSYDSGVQTTQQTFSDLRFGEYTVTWQDELLEYSYDLSDSVDTLDTNSASPLLMAPNTAPTSRTTRTVAVDVQRDGSDTLPPVVGNWGIESVSHPLQFTAAGTADDTDVTPSLGTFSDGRVYSIVFVPEANYLTPTPGNVTAQVSTQTFTGNFIGTAATGDITVTPSDEAATWTLTGSLGYDSGTQTGTDTMTGLDYDTYTATFDDNLLALTKPADDVKALDGPTLDMSGDYGSARSTGTIGVVLQTSGGSGGPDGSSWVVTAVGFPEAQFRAASSFDYDSEYGSLETGTYPEYYIGRTYNCVFSEVAGYTVPQKDDIVWSSTHYFFGDYAPDASVGIVNVDVTPNLDQGWTLDGPSAYQLVSSGDASIGGREPGAYTITFDAESGYTTPPGDGGTLVAESQLNLSGNYVLIAGESGTVNIDVTPNLGQGWTLTGPHYPSGLSGNGDWSQTGLTVGAYTVVFDDDQLGYTKPSDDNDTLVDAGTINLAGNYGSLRTTFSVSVATEEDGSPAPANFGNWTFSNSLGLPISASGDSDTNEDPVVPTVGDFYVGRTYTLIFGAISNYNKPANQTVTSAGTYTGDYIAQAAQDKAIYGIGHSLLSYDEEILLWTKRIVETKGHAMTHDEYTYPGQGVEYNWDRNEDGSNTLAWQALATGNWNNIILTPNQDEMAGGGSGVVSHGGYWHDRANDPATGHDPTQGWLYTSWQARASQGGGQDPTWYSSLVASQAWGDGVVASINGAHDPPDMIHLPVGAKYVTALYNKIYGTGIPGLSEIDDVFNDTSHMNTTGRYYVALAFAAEIFGIDVTGADISYTDKWGAPPDGSTGPAPSQATATALQDLVAEVYGVAGSTGTITVTPSDSSATWTMTGPNGYNSGSQTGTQPIGSLEYGDYTVTWDDNLFGKTQPAVSVETLSSSTLGINGDYGSTRTVFDPSVAIQEDGSPAGANFGVWDITNDDGFSFTCTGDSDTNTAANPSVGSFYLGRSYTISYSAETSYGTPSDAAVTSSGVITGNYISQGVGDIQIVIESTPVDDVPQTTPWTLYGPNAPQTGEGTDTLTGQPAGTYYVKWGWTQDHWTPFGYDGDSSTHPNFNGAPENGPWTSRSQSLTGANSLSFNDLYVQRAHPTAAQTCFGTDIEKSGHWQGALDQADHARIIQEFNHTTTGAHATLDPNGWPLDNYPCSGPASFPAANGKTGPQTFWVFWEGNGTLSISGLGSAGLSNHVCTDGAGPTGTSFTVNIPNTLVNTESFLWITVVSSSASPNHLRTIEVVHEDSLGVAQAKDYRLVGLGGKYVNSETHRHHKAMSFLRNVTNGTTTYNTWPTAGEGTWGPYINYEALGRTPDMFAPNQCYTIRQAYQWQIDMCNSTGKDFWVNFPMFPDPRFEADTSMADTLISMIEAPYTGTEGGGLRNDLKVIVEWSNENWNFFGDFKGWHYSAFWGRRHAGDTTMPADAGGGLYVPPWSVTPGFEDVSGDSGTGLRYNSYRTWHIASRYKANANYQARESQYGWTPETNDRPSRDRVIITVCGMNANLSNNHLRFATSSTGPNIQFTPGTDFIDIVDWYGAANYTSNPGIGVWGTPWPPAPQDFESRAQGYFDNWLQELWGSQRSNLQYNVALAARYGLQYVAYEGGQHISPASDNQSAASWLDYLQNHPRMYQIHQELYKQWRAEGGTLRSNYKSPMFWRNNGDPYFWGLKSSYNQPDDGAYRFMALTDFACNNFKWW